MSRRGKTSRGNVPLEAAHDLGLGLALGGAPGHVVLGLLVTAHTDQRDAPQGAVSLAIPATVQPGAGSFGPTTPGTAVTSGVSCMSGSSISACKACRRRSQGTQRRLDRRGRVGDLARAQGSAGPDALLGGQLAQRSADRLRCGDDQCLELGTGLDSGLHRAPAGHPEHPDHLDLSVARPWPGSPWSPAGSLLGPVPPQRARHPRKPVRRW
jgi:hypothetical protein